MRNQGIDFLRGIAVLLVLAHHTFEIPENHSGFFYQMFSSLRRGGWIGVDLFFVLSGFLVSGLLLKEFQRHGKIRVFHFLVRRGFKIYPGYYILLALTPWLLPWTAPTWAYLSEGLFLQNYGPRLWNHTWSLAVEEHFYIGVAVFLPFALNRQQESKKDFIPLVIFLTCATVLGIRMLTHLGREFSNQTHIFATHLRIDSLLFGLFLSYVLHFKTAAWEKLIHRVSPLLFVLAIGIILPAFLWELQENFYLGTIGLTLNYLAFGIVLIGSLKLSATRTFPFPLPIRIFSLVGFYSYSIYLWHIPIKWKTYFLLKRYPSIAQNFWLSTAIYLVLSVVIGIVLGKLIEIPFLRLRDRSFPSRS